MVINEDHTCGNDHQVWNMDLYGIGINEQNNV